jgi:hypothetical protein
MFEVVLYRAALAVGLQRCNFCRYEVVLMGINCETSESASISIVDAYYLRDPVKRCVMDM